MVTKCIALVALLATAVVAAPMPEAEAARWEGNNRQYWGGHGRKGWGKWRTKTWSQEDEATSTEAAASEATVAANNYAAESSNTQSSGDYQYSGIASYYDISNPAENEGYSAGSVSCSSDKYSNSDFIVAIASQEYDGGAHCGKQVEIKDSQTGNVATATVVDQCMSCSDGQLDLTPDLWKSLHGSNTDAGVFDISWKFL